MPVIELTVQHGRTLDEARRRLETAVDEISDRFRTVVQRVEWASDRNRVMLNGVGFWVEMQVDARAVHAKADLSILRGLLGAPLVSGLKQIIQDAFQKKLP
jgi:hypothetical protein